MLASDLHAPYCLLHTSAAPAAVLVSDAGQCLQSLHAPPRSCCCCSGTVLHQYSPVLCVCVCCILIGFTPLSCWGQLLYLCIHQASRLLLDLFNCMCRRAHLGASCTLLQQPAVVPRVVDRQHDCDMCCRSTRHACEALKSTRAQPAAADLL